MTVTAPRIAPLVPPYADDLRAMLEKWMPPGSGLEPLALFRTLGKHPDLAARARPLGAGILARGLVDPRLRELMIHRTCALTGAEYEWGVHAVAFGRPLGFTDAQLRATVHGDRDDGLWSDAERAVLDLAEALHADSDISDELFATLRAHLTEAQIIELCLAAGWYHAVAYVINVARVPLEPWAERFAPADPGGR